METVMVKTIAAGCTVLLTALALWACNDKIDVKQAYPFRLTSWHLPEEIAEGENVEIRLTLTREGDFHDAEYYIGYIQMKGKGEVTDDEGTLLVNREFHALDDMPGSTGAIRCGRCLPCDIAACRTKTPRYGSSSGIISDSRPN